MRISDWSSDVCSSDLIRLRHRIDPDARRAAAYQRRVGLERARHRFQLAPKVDQQAIAIVAVEEVIFCENIVEAAHGRASDRFARRGKGKAVPSCLRVDRKSTRLNSSH